MPPFGSSARILPSRCPGGSSDRLMEWIRFLAAAEDLTSKYRFGVYDLLFLPESFPYGGELRARTGIYLC